MNRTAIISFALLLVFCVSVGQILLSFAFHTYPSTIHNMGTIIENTVELTRIRKHIVMYRGSITDEAADFAASNFDVVVTGYEGASTIDKIKVLNPNITILMSRNIMAMQPYYEDWKEVDSHEDWFLHDIHGNRLINKYWNCYGMDVGNLGWRSHFASYVKDKLSRFLFDGVFADETWDVFYADSYFNPWTVPVEDIPIEIKNRWHNDMLEMIRFVKATIGNKLLLVNSSNNGDYVDACDGKMDEQFAHPPSWSLDEFGGGWYLNAWRDRVDSLRNISQNGKYYLAQSGTVIPENPTEDDVTKVHNMMIYCLSSYLLGVSGGKATFGFSNEYSVDGSVYCAEFDVSLGYPVNSYYQLGSVYSREFEKGIVLVNPTTSSYTVDLESEYTTLNGQIVSNVTLDAHSGIIVLRA